MRSFRIFLGVLLIIYILFSCQKNKEQKWKLRSIDFHTESRYYLITGSEHSDKNLYEISTGDNIVFFELQEWRNFSGQVTKLRGLGIEIPENNHPMSFDFSDEMIYDSLKAQAYHYDVNDDEYFSRIHSGWIKGEKTNGQWSISYHVQFGENLEFYVQSK